MRALGAVGALVVGLGWVWALGAAASVAPPPPASPGRIVSVAPSITEALYAVGAGERVVAVSDYCARPAAVRDLPRVGGLHNPRLETLVGLRPDLVVTLTPQRWLRDRLGALGFASVTVGMNDPREVPAALEAIGRAVGRGEAGGVARRALDRRVADLVRRVPKGPPKRVLWLFERDPDSLQGMVGLGPQGYLHGLIEMAGGHNVLSGSPVVVPQVSAERVIRLAPDVVLEHAVFYEHLGAGWRARVSKPWLELLGDDAVRAGRVRFVTDDAAVSPGPRMADALALLIDLLHGPEHGD